MRMEQRITIIGIDKFIEPYQEHHRLPHQTKVVGESVDPYKTTGGGLTKINHRPWTTYNKLTRKVDENNHNI